MKDQIQLTDQQIVSMYTAGDESVFTILVNRYKKQILKSIYLLVKDKHLAEDISQDVFIRIINSLRNGHYTEEGKFIHWARRIAHNLCIDYFAKIKRNPTIKPTDDRDIFDTLDFSITAIDSFIIDNQTSHEIRSMIDLLREEQREIIILRYYADLSFKQIAKLSNCSINTSLSRMNYALLNIRKMIIEKQIDL